MFRYTQLVTWGVALHYWGIGKNADYLVIVWDCPIQQKGNAPALYLNQIGKEQ